ncbi:hypothetical protein HGRIS_009848 [Hohenbuehelia grisea]|uniref:Isochorismatase-like domain-containing protein n=1 Tax=Hohenbuehelia grisea TaxID=104357 RepID=A0ABR3J2T9_9AGAR
MPVHKPDPAKTLFFLCDVQTRFRNAIHGFDQVATTANKLLKVASILGCGVVATTQNAKALGPIVPEIDLEGLGSLHLGTFDKTLFSMFVPEVKAILASRPEVDAIVLFGIESHVCVLQTALSLLDPSSAPAYTVYIPADGVSSCNKTEVPIALARLREAGAIITTSESIAFQLVSDSARPEFKAFSTLIKESKDSTKAAGEALLSHL